ncbi:SDR family NAD(P)-dependent oxidoreductase, partial [Brevundimonas sp.]
MSDRVIAVTGGHGVLGRAVVEAAVADGLRVAVIDHATGRETPEGVLELGGVDLTDSGAAERAMAAVVERFGRLDALLNIAGGFIWQTVDDAEPAWDRMFALNVTTALNASRAALPHLKRSDEGRIVNVGANGALKSAAGMGAYAASKSGVHRLTESLAEELKTSSV